LLIANSLFYMETVEIIEKTNRFLVEEFEVDESIIKPEANLKETLDLDSLDYIDLVVVIESNFGFRVKAEDFVGIVTFQDFYDYVISRVNQKELA
jgi:acyl carrier protein